MKCRKGDRNGELVLNEREKKKSIFIYRFYVEF
jgi:hypothetical protein